MTNIKIAREKSGKKQQECANAIGVTLRAWQTYEQGIREPKFELLIKIADMFNVSLDYLLGRETGEPETLDKLVGEFNMSALEKEILDNYLSLPKDMRSDLMEFLQKSVKKVMEENESVQSNAQSKSKIYISKTAARNGEPPGEKILTQEELDEIRSRPDADPDM